MFSLETIAIENEMTNFNFLYNSRIFGLSSKSFHFFFFLMFSTSEKQNHLSNPDF